MSFNFPNSPTNGQTYTPVGGYQYVFLDGVWRIVEPSNLFGVTKIASGVVASAVPTFTFPIPTTGYQALELIITDFTVSAAGASITMLFSWDGGATFPSGPSAYAYSFQTVKTNNVTNTHGGYEAGSGLTTAIYPLQQVPHVSAWTKGTAQIWFPIVEADFYVAVQTSSSGTENASDARLERSLYVANSNFGPPNYCRISSYTGTILPGCKWQLNGVR